MPLSVFGDLASVFGGSNSKPFLNLSKNFGDLFKQASGMGPNAQPAIDTYKNLGAELGGLFANYGAGQREQINKRFDTQQNNAMGSLAKRGFSGSSLASATGSAVTRDRSLALGDLEDQLLGQQIGAKQNVAQGLAGAQMGAADLNQQLIRSLLGLSESTSNNGQAGLGGGGGSSGTRSGSSSSGGGGGGGGGSVSPGLPTGPGYFDQIAQRNLDNYMDKNYGDKNGQKFTGTDGQQWETVQTPYGPITRRA